MAVLIFTTGVLGWLLFHFFIVSELPDWRPGGASMPHSVYLGIGHIYWYVGVDCRYMKNHNLSCIGIYMTVLPKPLFYSFFSTWASSLGTI